MTLRDELDATVCGVLIVFSSFGVCLDGLYVLRQHCALGGVGPVNCDFVKVEWAGRHVALGQPLDTGSWGMLRREARFTGWPRAMRLVAML